MRKWFTTVNTHLCQGIFSLFSYLTNYISDYKFYPYFKINASSRVLRYSFSDKADVMHTVYGAAKNDEIWLPLQLHMALISTENPRSENIIVSVILCVCAYFWKGASGTGTDQWTKGPVRRWFSIKLPFPSKENWLSFFSFKQAPLNNRLHPDLASQIWAIVLPGIIIVVV